MTAPYSQRGVTLVEALVALLVMSIGMLGIAALFVESVKANRSAIFRTQAVYLANDMADRIRANRLARGSYVLAVGALPPTHNCVSTAAPGVNCTRANLAEDDLARWVASVRGTLPPGPGGALPETSIAFAPAGAVGLPDTYTILIRWREPQQDPADPPYTYQLNMQLIPSRPL